LTIDSVVQRGGHPQALLKKCPTVEVGLAPVRADAHVSKIEFRVTAVTR